MTALTALSVDVSLEADAPWRLLSPAPADQLQLVVPPSRLLLDRSIELVFASFPFFCGDDVENLN